LGAHWIRAWKDCEMRAFRIFRQAERNRDALRLASLSTNGLRESLPGLVPGSRLWNGFGTIAISIVGLLLHYRKTNQH
jgi:hypothetical protein